MYVTPASEHAKQIGVDKKTIYRRMRRLHGNKPWEDYTLDEIRSLSKKLKTQTAADHAKQIGISQFTMYYRMRNKYPGKPWSDYTMAEVQAVSKKPKRAMSRKS